MRKYFKAKEKLFHLLKDKGIAVLNVDCPYGKRLYQRLPARIFKRDISICGNAYLRVVSRKTEDFFQDIIIEMEGKKSFRLKTYLLGEHNVYNILLASAICLSTGVDVSSIVRGVENTKVIPGRLQFLRHKGILGFVDYAHTPDALYKVLVTLKSMGFRRIITVFGCGGDRDGTKRPKMGEVASLLSDTVILTDDNPREEDPTGIIRDILRGVKKENILIRRPRREAIKKAVQISRKGDAILIAGKGHEQYQIVKGKKRFFDDYQYLREYLRCLK